MNTPLRLFRRVAFAEAVTWALLLACMFVKYATQAVHWGELGVTVFGMVHGVVFIAFCLTTLLVWVDQRWSPGRLLLGLASALPPFATVLLDRYAEQRGWLDTSWRLTTVAPADVRERVAAWLLRNPARGLVAALVAVAALTAGALMVGPPVG